LLKNARRHSRNTYEIRRRESGDKRNGGDDNTEYSSENKSYIYKYIVNYPGVHLRKICRELGLAMGDTQYQLSILEKEGRIKSSRVGNHRHYCSLTIPNEQNELILAFLRQETIRDVLVYLMENPGSSQQALANFKNVSAPTIKWHMSRLIELELVMVAREGKVVKYFIKDPRSLTSCVKNYMPSLWNSLVNRFAEKFFEISLVKTKDSNNRK
jgi:DNA-binding MarR family transcriptional regulator